MFNNIDELEKEIQDNIIASNKLIQTLQDVIEALKGQSNDFKRSSTKLESELSTHLTELKKLSDDTVVKVEADLKSNVEENSVASSNTIKSILNQNVEQIKKIKAEHEKTVAEIKASQAEQLKKLDDTEARLNSASDELEKKYADFLNHVEITNAEQIKKIEAEHEKTVVEIKASQAEQLKKLDDTEVRLNSASDELEKKYADFLNRLETTNVDQIFQSCEQMKKSLETKLLFVAGGVGVAVILTVISFFIK